MEHKNNKYMGPSESKFHRNLKKIRHTIGLNTLLYPELDTLKFVSAQFSYLYTHSFEILQSVYPYRRTMPVLMLYRIAIKLWNSFMNLKSLAGKTISQDFSIYFINLTLNFSCWHILCALKVWTSSQMIKRYHNCLL